MRLTLYEIETTLCKASTGAGLPLGLGEDIGSAAIWLAGQNCDGVAAALESIQAGMSKVKMSDTGNGVMIFSDACIAVSGPSIVDLLIGDQSCTEIHLCKPDSVMLLFGFAGVVANRYGYLFQFDFSNGANVQVSGDKVVETGEMHDLCSDVVVKSCIDQKGLAVAPMPAAGVDVDDELWCEVLALAAKNCVPESDASRVAGAGAGLTDND
ncbi:MAG: DUF3726 domain-containing protein [Granulosicoccus sp.]